MKQAIPSGLLVNNNAFDSLMARHLDCWPSQPGEPDAERTARQHLRVQPGDRSVPVLLHQRREQRRNEQQLVCSERLGRGVAGRQRCRGFPAPLDRCDDAGELRCVSKQRQCGHRRGGRTFNQLQVGDTPGFSANQLALGNGVQAMSFALTPAASIWYGNTAFSLQ